MSTALAITLNVVFDVAIALVIVGLLGYSISTHWRDFGHAANRRRSRERRKVAAAAAVPPHRERRRGERRRGEPVTA